MNGSDATSTAGRAAGACGLPHPLTETLAWTGLAVALLVLPWFVSAYALYMGTLVAINVVATVGLNITVGYAGLLSIGHSAFLGVGAYVSALLLLRLGTPLALNVVAGALAAFLAGLLFGIPSLRIKGVFLAIATLAAQYSLYFIFQQWTQMTGGDRGLSLPRADMFGLRDHGFFYVAAGLAALICLAGRNLFRTRIGRAFIAVRERDYAAQVLGIDVVRTKLLAFGIGAACAGVAGALTATFLRIVNPDQFTLPVSVFFLAATIVGGRASILGSILGAAFMTLVPEALRGGLDLMSRSMTLDVAGILSPLREMTFGILIVGFLMFEPQGIAGLALRALRRNPATLR